MATQMGCFIYLFVFRSVFFVLVFLQNMLVLVSDLEIQYTTTSIPNSKAIVCEMVIVLHSQTSTC